MENVLSGRLGYVGFWRSWARRYPEADIAEAFRLLERVGLAEMVDKRADELSGGQRQRVGICRALIQNPELLLVDEPTASLDLAYQMEVASLLHRLNRDRGVSMVLATHDLNLAASLCDSLVLVRSGRVLAHGPTHDVLTVAMIRQLYDVDADVHVHEASGRLTVVPIRHAPEHVL